MVSKARQYERLERNGWSPAQTHIGEFDGDVDLYPGFNGGDRR